MSWGWEWYPHLPWVTWLTRGSPQAGEGYRFHQCLGPRLPEVWGQRSKDSGRAQGQVVGRVRAPPRMHPDHG